jgi:hypothetical protein
VSGAGRGIKAITCSLIFERVAHTTEGVRFLLFGHDDFDDEGGGARGSECGDCGDGEGGKANKEAGGAAAAAAATHARQRAYLRPLMAAYVVYLTALVGMFYIIL